MLTPSEPQRSRLTWRQDTSLGLRTILKHSEEVLMTIDVSRFLMMSLWVEFMRQNGLSANELR